MSMSPKDTLIWWRQPVFTFKKNGKRFSEQGLIVTVLQSGSNGWHITSWAWAKQ
jgi:hypothetical protein